MPWETEEAVEEYRSEVRTVTVTLSSGNMRFDVVESVDSAGAVRSRFAAGEKVRMHVKYTNKGDVTSDARLVITDVDTGAVLEDSKATGIAPDKFVDGTYTIGTMPERNWNLRVEVTP